MDVDPALPRSHNCMRIGNEPGEVREETARLSVAALFFLPDFTNRQVH
jgi:hypothetical protein